MSELLETVENPARSMGDPDRVVAVRVDGMFCLAELDTAPHPVNPWRLD